MYVYEKKQVITEVAKLARLNDAKLAQEPRIEAEEAVAEQMVEELS
jgi:hypothetical protein